MKAKKRLFWVLSAVFGVMIFAILACGDTSPSAPTGPTATPGPIPTATLRVYVPPPDEGPKYDITRISTDASDIANTTVTNRMNQNAATVGITIALLVIAVGFWIVPFDYWLIALVIVSIIAGNFTSSSMKSGIPEKRDAIRYTINNDAITNGMSFAQRAQAVNDQYIHATVIEIGMDSVPCQGSDHTYRDFCGDNTEYYNSWTTQENCHSVPDSDGKGSHTECDTVWHYENWFDQIVKYWAVLDTKAKYLDEQIYHQKCVTPDGGSVFECHRDEYGRIDDKSNPLIYLHNDWRAPEDVNAHRQKTWGGGFVDAGQFNNHVPQDWANVRNVGHACNGGNVCGGNFVATVVGPYLNYGFASGSPLFEPVTTHYQDLLKIAVLPSPNGAAFQEKDAFGKDTVLQTSLYGIDGDLPLHFNPVAIIGNCLSPDQIGGYADYAMQFQGHFGPKKQGSARWYLVCDNIVQAMGGMQNVLTGIKAFERDPVVQGKFAMPKNLVDIVESISMDGASITGRGMETGMPAGNDLVLMDMMASIPQGQTLPLTKENVFGVFNSGYDSAAQVQTNIKPVEGGVSVGMKLFYQYSDMTQSGGAIGILYATDPNYVPPDPSAKGCQIPKPDHHGFVRYDPCNYFFLESSVQINRDGYNLIMGDVQNKATAAVSIFWGWFFMLLSIGAAIWSFIARQQYLSEQREYAARQTRYRRYR